MQFDLPRMETARDAATAAGAELKAVALGELAPTEGAHIMWLLETYRRALETSELEARVGALEGGATSHLKDGWRTWIFAHDPAQAT